MRLCKLCSCPRRLSSWRAPALKLLLMSKKVGRPPVTIACTWSSSAQAGMRCIVRSFRTANGLEKHAGYIPPNTGVSIVACNSTVWLQSHKLCRHAISSCTALLSESCNRISSAALTDRNELPDHRHPGC